MRIWQKIVLLIICCSIAGGIALFIKKRQSKIKKSPFKTEAPQQRTIKHTIAISGVLEIKGIMKVGSIQTGSVKDIFVKENEPVKKGQLLAVIDWAKGDADVQAATHRVARAREEHEYQKLFFERQKALYQSGQLSKNAFQNYLKDYQKSHEDLQTEQALLEKSTLEYESTRIKAPDNGTIIAAYATKGMVASDVSNTNLFEIAQDVTLMKATLTIDESEIGHVKKGQKVVLTPNSFPDMLIKNTITDVSYAPQIGTAKGDVPASYAAYVDIDNKHHLFHPGMIVNGHINVQKAKQALSTSVLAFYLDTNIIKAIAAKNHYGYVPLSDHEQKKLIKAKPDEVVKFVWVVSRKKFIQKAVTLGLSDNTYCHIKDGVSASDRIVLEVEEPDDMEEIYKKWFRGGLS